MKFIKTVLYVEKMDQQLWLHRRRHQHHHYHHHRRHYHLHLIQHVHIICIVPTNNITSILAHLPVNELYNTNKTGCKHMK